MKFSFQKIATLSYLCLLASCAHAPSGSQQTAQSAAPAVQPQSFAPETVSSGPVTSSADHRVKYNVPSAPLTTPLCGTAMQEQAQTGQKIYTQSVISGNSCVQNACFQPLTGVYISQTGNPVVCR